MLPQTDHMQTHMLGQERAHHHITRDDPVRAGAYLDQKMLGLGASLAISHQLLLTFPVGEENIK